MRYGKLILGVCCVSSLSLACSEEPTGRPDESAEHDHGHAHDEPAAQAATAPAGIPEECRGFSFDAPPWKYCTDNAAMIALAGAERLVLGMTSPLDAPARPRWPLDEAAALAQPMNKFGRKGAKS